MLPMRNPERPEVPVPARRLRRADRRDQILSAATRAFARTGFAATSLDDIAAEAGVSRVILYRHFESKTDLYRAVLVQACLRLQSVLGDDESAAGSVESLLDVAAEDPDAFRLLFHHAVREPAFRAEVDAVRAGALEIARRYYEGVAADRSWATWAAKLAPTVAIDAVIAWLDAGQPDRDQAAGRILQVLAAITEAAVPLER